jgi:hypothetical protein
MTFIEAANEVLRRNGNIPMSSSEIWSEIEKFGIYKSDGKTPWASLNTIMLGASDNTTIKQKQKRSYYTIVSKNPIKFIMLESNNGIIEEDFDLSEGEIIENIESIKSASEQISKCISDTDYLSDLLNNVDRNYLHKYYNSDKSGVVIDIRKDVAKEILLSFVDSNKILEIINSHKSSNQRQLKAWSNPYKILHPLINYKYRNLDIFAEKFTKFIVSKMGDVKYTISNFNGSQHQGSDEYWIAIYNSCHHSQSDALQLFFFFKEGNFYYGIYNYLENKHLIQNEFTDLNKFYDFIDINSELILNDVEKSSDVLIKKVRNYLESSDNIGKKTSEIISGISSNISESSLKSILVDVEDFELDDDKWKIKNQIPGTGKLKKYLTEQGFITVDILIKILEKNGIKLEDIDV